MDRLIEHMYSDGSDPEPTASSALRIVGLASDDKHRFSKSRHEAWFSSRASGSRAMLMPERGIVDESIEMCP
jgi:hypothetical protein